MKEFRNKIARKVRFSGCSLVFSGVLFIIMAKMFPMSSGASLTYGFFSGILLVAIFFTIRMVAALNNEDKLKQLYIEETDERNIQLRRMTGSTAIPFILFGISIAMIVSSFINMTVCITLVCTAVFASLVTIITRIIYNNIM